MGGPSQELPSFRELEVRLPEAADGPFQGREQAWPLIVTPGLSEPTPDSLKRFLADNGDSVTDALCRFGAILFRGFGIQSEIEFESTILSIDELQSMASYFMSEPCRDRVYSLTNGFYRQT